MKSIKTYVVFLASLLVSTAGATKPEIPSLKMEISITHNGNWEVGEDNTVTFTFKPLEEVKHRNKHPDEASIVFDSGLVFVSGDTNWSGFLEKGEEYTISITLKPNRGGKFVIGGGVSSCLSKIYTKEERDRLEEEQRRIIEASEELKKKGVKAKFPEKVFMFHNGTSAIIVVKGPASDAEDTSWQEFDGVKIRRVTMKRPLDSLRTPVVKEGKKIPQEKPESKGKADSSQSESSDAVDPPYRVSGTFRYLNNFGQYWPVTLFSSLSLFLLRLQ